MENTFPIYKVDAIVQFFRTEVLTGQEAKHFAKADVTPNPKVGHHTDSCTGEMVCTAATCFLFAGGCHPETVHEDTAACVPLQA